MINNFKQIKSLMEFRSEDDFYFIQILQRKKENPDLPKSVKLIDSYYIDSIDKLERYENRIIEQCNQYKARAYINLNRRSFKKVGLEVLKETARLVAEETYKPIKNIYNTACGRTSNEKNEKKWIIDIDDVQFDSQLKNLINELEQLDPKGNKFIDRIKTKNGYHVITKPFNTNQFNNLFKGWFQFDKPDIHKNNPTVLYCI
jgi:hypothetical protein